MVELCPHPATERAGMETLHLRMRAPAPHPTRACGRRPAILPPKRSTRVRPARRWPDRPGCAALPPLRPSAATRCIAGLPVGRTCVSCDRHRNSARRRQAGFRSGCAARGIAGGLRFPAERGNPRSGRYAVPRRPCGTLVAAPVRAATDSRPNRSDSGGSRQPRRTLTRQGQLAIVYCRPDMGSG